MNLYKDSHSNRHKLIDWERTALEQFETKMTDKKKPFPCIPATIGFSTNQLRYGFVGDPRKHSSVIETAELLRDFTNVSKKIGTYTSLIVFYKLPQDIKDTFVVEDYEQLFWQHLSELTAMDHIDWPEHIPKDPHHPIWEFCFHGERYFMFCGTPAHTKRISRHFPTMMLAITPRWVLQEFNKPKNRAKKIKDHIRKRLRKYDAADIHSDLNSYGAKDNYEWKQYFLRDNHTTLSKCPYHRFLRLFK
ncbi:YqcI/YcgG family protein [Gracilibacillus sp. YIM 98692]|uniref:YqcI/YcgG family protein n=1 Tax=Gracilibacillus sp. YIM 98692 TaxID=2663532 RepID=UPI0013D6F3C4|nr:YqcI/YcgG family protein [Gracilibacillus sp. YIM 98692]